MCRNMFSLNCVSDLNSEREFKDGLSRNVKKLKKLGMPRLFK